MARFKAYYIAKDIPIQKIKGQLPFIELSLTRETAVYKLKGGQVFVYSFGSIVFVDISPSEEKSFITELGRKIHLKGKKISEEYELIKDPKARHFIVRSSCTTIKSADNNVLGVVARILGQSVALECYEDEFERIGEEFSRLNHCLAENGRLDLSSKEIMRMIARNNMVLEEIVSGIGVLDKPDAAWESGMLDALHTKLSDEFELEERFQNINSRMHFVQENYKVFLESLRSRNDTRLEWIIITLIAIEIVLFVYELFW